MSGAEVQRAVDVLAKQLGLIASVEAAPGRGRAADRRAGDVAVAAVVRRVGIASLPREHAKDGRPLWPAGWTGSVSHGAGTAIAAMVPTATWSGIGIDVEGVSALEVDDAAGVLDGDELAAVTSADQATLRWSAKEAAFKAWSMAAGGLDRVDPRDLHVEPTTDGQLQVTAAGALRSQVRPTILCGRWQRCGDLVITALVVPPVAQRRREAGPQPSISSTMPST